MLFIDFLQEARTLEEKTEHLARKRVFEADTFGITLVVYDKEAKTTLHECGKDEFFYVLKGEVEMQVEGKSTFLKEGEGYLVKAGKKHVHRAVNRAWVLITTKHPHKHKFYDAEQ